MNKNIRTAEFVTPSHPDKVCDQISDAILDECLKKDKNSRVAVEVMGGHGEIKIMGEVTTKAKVDYEGCAQRIYSQCGYDQKISVEVNISKQSPEISQGVDTGGAGDQGIMVGYACRENSEFIPQEHFLAKSLCKFLYEKHKKDGKTQVTINENKVDLVVVSMADLKKEEIEKMVKLWISENDFNVNFEGCNIIINPAGDWAMSGFDADAGLTGRKIVVDSYGPRVPVGGGCFSGKDPTKVDRSAAYMARKVALDYLKKNGADEALVRLAYAIGKREPVMKIVELDGKTERIEGYDLTPRGIIESLDLKRPIYQNLSGMGHFGRKDLPWEN